MPIAGLTRSDAIPWMSRMKKAGGNVARHIARRACAVDLVKIVKLRRGPGIVAIMRTIMLTHIRNWVVEYLNDGRQLNDDVLENQCTSPSIYAVYTEFLGSQIRAHSSFQAHKSALHQRFASANIKSAEHTHVLHGFCESHPMDPKLTAGPSIDHVYFGAHCWTVAVRSGGLQGICGRPWGRC
jgi:hypothetical protein